jgi:PQQ-dependent dehydrogenase (methanol/ethanol family)
LGLVWAADMETIRGLEATPLIVDGVLYTSGSWGVVMAFDAQSGKRLWEYDPEVPGRWGRYGCCDVVNRGVAYWEGKIFVGAFDGRLIAIDARTGQEIWQVKTTDQSKPYTSTGAPRVINGKVIIGNGGAEFGVRGYFSAYDADSGKMLWRFYTVPASTEGPHESPALEKAAATWSKDTRWEVGGGGTVWDSMAYDPELDLLYVGVGNGSPWGREIRSPGGGDNLYLSSILAVNPDDGSLVWHYQTTPGDSWDYTATQHILLTDLELDGRTRKVLMQAPKNGFFYILDRATGELLSADKYIDATWASHVDMKTGRPVETGRADWSHGPKMVMPFDPGGHNWPPMSINPGTGLVYIPTHVGAMLYKPDDNFTHQPGGQNLGMDLPGIFKTFASGAETGLEQYPVHGELQAWDPIARKKIWGVMQPRILNGGTLSTAGNLVFQGTGDGRFVAYKADDGTQLWQVHFGNGILGSPVTYSVDGKQYISVLAGWGGAAMIGHDAGKVGPLKYFNDGYLLTFALDGKAAFPDLEVRDYTLSKPLSPTGTEQQVKSGMDLYHIHCARCHGAMAVGVNMLPDLRQSINQTNDVFADIVLHGLLQDNGMAGFSDLLNEPDVEAIRAFIIKRANEDYRAQESASEPSP